MSFLGPNPAPPQQLSEVSADVRQRQLSEAAARQARQQPEMDLKRGRLARIFARFRSRWHR